MRNKIKAALRQFIKDESGLSAVEYGLLAAGIAVGLYTIIAEMGVSLETIYGAVRDDLALTTS